MVQMFTLIYTIILSIYCVLGNSLHDDVHIYDPVNSIVINGVYSIADLVLGRTNNNKPIRSFALRINIDAFFIERIINSTPWASSTRY